jgi:primosomal protein N''
MSGLTQAMEENLTQLKVRLEPLEEKLQRRTPLTKVEFRELQYLREQINCLQDTLDAMKTEEKRQLESHREYLLADLNDQIKAIKEAGTLEELEALVKARNDVPAD